MGSLRSRRSDRWISTGTAAWYEVGRLPMRWEQAEASDITAEYTVEGDGTVRVDNRCIDKMTKPSQAALGQAGW